MEQGEAMNYSEKNERNRWKKTRRRILTKRKWNARPNIVDKLHSLMPVVFYGMF